MNLQVWLKASLIPYFKQSCLPGSASTVVYAHVSGLNGIVLSILGIFVIAVLVMPLC